MANSEAFADAADHDRILVRTPVGISRGVPRSISGYQRLRELEPGPWFKSVPPGRYMALCGQILDRLDPSAIRNRLFGYGDIPVMLCWEAAHDCHAGSKWCHHHIVAQWLKDRLDIEVQEVGFPNLDRFAYLRNLGLPAPSYRVPRRIAVGKQRLR